MCVYIYIIKLYYHMIIYEPPLGLSALSTGTRLPAKPR